MSHHVKLSKRERAAQLPFVGRVHKWRRVWVAAKATKINVRLIKWVKTSASGMTPPPPPLPPPLPPVPMRPYLLPPAATLLPCGADPVRGLRRRAAHGSAGPAQPGSGGHQGLGCAATTAQDPPQGCRAGAASPAIDARPGEWLGLRTLLGEGGCLGESCHLHDLTYSMVHMNFCQGRGAYASPKGYHL